MTKSEHVLIVGGGFAGVKAALELSKDPHFKITLLSDEQELRYYPTLYHTATGGSRANSSIPLKTIFEGKAVRLATGKALKIDRKFRSVSTEAGETYTYDTLLLALGVVTNYFGIKGLAEYAYSIKTQAEVARFKQHLHNQLLNDRQPDLNYVIVGGGPTGIELAGALPSYIKHIMQKHGLADRNIHIDLVEAFPRLLPRLPKGISRSVKRQLRRLGIRLYLDSAVQAETGDELIVNGRPIRSHTVIWTAGVTNHPFFADNEFVLTKRGKVAVDVYLQAEDNIFVLGDNANTPYSGMAQTALFDGRFVAQNLRRRARGKDMKAYKPKHPISVIPAGPHWAAVSLGPLQIAGFTGYLLREAADFRGFHYLEPWDRATRQFLTEFYAEDLCEVCATHQ